MSIFKPGTTVRVNKNSLHFVYTKRPSKKDEVPEVDLQIKRVEKSQTGRVIEGNYEEDFQPPEAITKIKFKDGSTIFFTDSMLRGNQNWVVKTERE